MPITEKTLTLTYNCKIEIAREPGEFEGITDVGNAFHEAFNKAIYEGDLDAIAWLREAVVDIEVNEFKETEVEAMSEEMKSSIVEAIKDIDSKKNIN